MKRQYLLKDSKDRARARAPLGTPSVIVSKNSGIQILKRSEQPQRDPLTRQAPVAFSTPPGKRDRTRSNSQSDQEDSTCKNDPELKMSYYDDPSGFSPYAAFTSELRLPQPRRGESMMFKSELKP